MQVAENGADAMRRVYDDEDAHMYASPTDSKSVNAMLSDEEDEEEAECRVCRGEAEPDRRLYAPCKCSGSIRFIHSECLEQWLEHSGKDYCELCSHKFEFKPLYDQNAPDVLPTQELVATVLSMVFYKWLPFVVRACMVAALWLGVAPWCTSWLYRMWLLRASAMVNVNFSERFDVTHVVADVYSGIVLIVIIIFSFLALMSFADFLRFHLDHIEAEAADLRLNEIIHIPVEPVAPAVAAPPPAPIVDEVEEGEQHMPFPGVIAQHPREELGLPAIRPAEEDVLMEDHRPEQELRQRRPLGDAVEGPRAPVVVDQAQPVRNMPAPGAPPRRPPPRNNNRDAWDDDFEHMEINIAMDELLGLRGDIVVLFRNVSWLLAFNGAYLGLFAFIPYTLGSTISTAATKIFSSLPIASTLSAFIADDPNVPVDDLSIGGFFVRMLISAMEVAKKNGDCLQLVDLCTCVVGYVSICFTIVLWRWMVTTASPFMNRPLMGGVQWALRCLTAIVKVSTLLLLKMVALPIILGYGIDVATLRLFSATMQERIVFSTQHMVGSLLIHWVVGISFMLFITVSVLQLREVMHPDILAKVIRPQEAHPDLLRSILGETCMKHAKRMILSLIIYAGLLTMLIHIPIRLLHSSAPSLFPVVLRFQYYSPEIQVPLELLVVHLIVLAILEHAKNEIGRLQHLGINFFCSQFGLTEHILPRVKVSWTSHTAQVGEEWVLGPPPLHFHPLAELPPDELRILGRRYLPWPEEGLEDSQPVEYELLPRRTPTKWLHARIATLLVVCWFVLVTSVGALMAGTFFLGRVSLAPLERLTGIQHDPLALAAGVQIVWYLANGLNALNVLTMPEVEVESALVRRGYCVKNMNAGNAIVSVFGWAFFGPLFLGYIMSMCIPSAQATGFESFWMGYLFFNLSAWFVCCFHLKRRRRQRRGQDILPEEDFNDNFDDFVEPEDFVDEVEEDMDEQVALANAVEGGGEAQERLAAENVLLSLRLCYTKLMFNLEVHDSDAIRLRRDNIRERCFDVQMFITEVMTPILGALLAVIVLCKIQSAIVMYAWSAVSSGHPETAHTVATIGAFLTVVLGSSHGLVKKWTNNLAESIRNERYLIGRQLQDMVR